jgi:cell division protein FtsW
MARFRRRAGEPLPLGPREHQLTIFERLESLARLVEAPDPARPAVRLLCVVIAMMGLGLVMQVSHAATISDPAATLVEARQQLVFRALGLGVLLLAYRVGPSGLRRLLPHLVLIAAIGLLLVWAPGVGKPENGAHRWIRVPVVGSFQPSELARVVMVVWVADRCTRLGPRLGELRRGVLPVLAIGLFFVAAIGLETDVGGALLFFGCFMSTLWVGGARVMHTAGTVASVGACAIVLAISKLQYIRGRIAVFLGNATNDQVDQATAAIQSGDGLGLGLARGVTRNIGVPYQDSDYVFALIGEELGLIGMVVTLGLISAFVWFSLRLVLSIRNRFAALSAFGLLLSVCVQAMLHVQVVTGLAPPKGMTLPFISDGGTSLVISSLAVGLALGAARETAIEEPASAQGDES